MGEGEEAHLADETAGRAEGVADAGEKEGQDEPQVNPRQKACDAERRHGIGNSEPNHPGRQKARKRAPRQEVRECQKGEYYQSNFSAHNFGCLDR